MGISLALALIHLAMEGSLVIHDRSSPEEVLKAIPEEKITHRFKVPVQLQMIWEHPDASGWRN